MNTNKKKVGIVGYGSLGVFLAKAILEDTQVKDKFELVFVWNRSLDKVIEDHSLPKGVLLENLEEFASKKADLIVEVCHPKIVAEYGEKFLQYADFMVGSPTAFANAELEKRLREVATKGNFGCYIPSGALWGAEDIEKMASRGTLGGLTITMKKHPDSLKVEPALMDRLKEYKDDEQKKGEFVVFEGGVRDLCPLAPNNVNTMACAALAATNLGFDKVKARLVADKSLEAHVIDIEVIGPPKENPEDIFRVTTSRYNPAKPGAVTGNATYTSFLSSMLRAHGRGNGFHFS